ncbi:tetratricopeptide repeat protein [Pseudoalteromonas viridis]|uniref:Tetratricopeptide repeat protein n=1 Tax=Pseudoalteromonas viridis TaxID=339617 RepID=A0ABX7V9U2_9GAMM|nr:tetratricopeptide repeat protein [Pseudoalteromonas viridis]QTL35960.1 tetratricopeptide repeat protein [Pseudoalteromonas viridis]
MNTPKLCALIIASVLLVSGCKSLVQKGNKLYEAGMYDQSAEFYEQALAEDPQDVEARQRLTLARNKIIDRGLIDVRMLRLSGNHTGAALKLEALLRNQVSWHIEPVGPMAETQNEELRYATSWLQQEALSLSRSAFPDPFRYFEMRYAFLIANARLGNTFAQYQGQLQENAERQCRKLKASQGQDRLFLQRFYRKYCQAWNITSSAGPQVHDRALYSEIRIAPKLTVQLHDTSTQKQRLQTVLSQLNEAFRDSLWYHPQGDKQFTLNVHATFKHTRDAKLVNRQKHYTLEQAQPNPAEPGSLMEVEVAKTYQYPVTEFTEYFSLDVMYQGRLGPQQIEHKVDDSQVHYTQSHYADFPQLDLTPQKAHFLDVNTRLDKQLSELRAQFKADLDSVWQQTYCEDKLGAASGEHVLRCAKLAPHHEYVNNWFNQHFGLSYQAMSSLYSL